MTLIQYQSGCNSTLFSDLHHPATRNELMTPTPSFYSTPRPEDVP